MKIVIDGKLERGPEVMYKAVEQALDIYPDLELTIVGKESEYKDLEGQHVRVVPCDKYVDNEWDIDELRERLKTRDFSIQVALDQTMPGIGDAQAMVTCSDTRANVIMLYNELMRGYGATENLPARQGRLKKVIRNSKPALASFFPAPTGRSDQRALWLDLGFTGKEGKYTPEQMAALGIMGASLYAATTSQSEPTVAYLSNAHEESQQRGVEPQAYELLKTLSGLHAVGFVEPNTAMGYDENHPSPDVIAVDGYTGNVCLKMAEGIMKGFQHRLLDRSMARKAMLGAGIYASGANEVIDEYNPNHNNGAWFVGIDYKDQSDGSLVLIKGHGGTYPDGLVAAIGQAYDAVERDIMARTNQRLREALD